MEERERTLQYKHAHHRSAPTFRAVLVSGLCRRRQTQAGNRGGDPRANQPGYTLSRVLHTSQLSLVSSSGSDEGLVDSNSDLTSDQRTTFDNAGGIFLTSLWVNPAPATRYILRLCRTLT